MRDDTVRSGRENPTRITVQLKFHTLDVFTETVFGGNPLAVVLDADALDTRRMQLIAREFNLSETVFLQKATQAGALVCARIFTPAKELPFAGHPTVGTACLLTDLGRVPGGAEVSFVLEEGVGPVPVTVRRQQGRPMFGELSVAKLPEFGPPVPAPAELAGILGLRTEDLDVPGDRPRAVSCGLPFVLVPVRSREVLGRIELDVALWKKALAGAWAHQILVYSRDPERPDAQIRARMFAPGAGVPEDPATGSAAVALAGALATESPQRDGPLAWLIEQGIEMGRPSYLHARAQKSGGTVTAVHVGGHALRVTQGVLHVTD